MYKLLLTILFSAHSAYGGTFFQGLSPEFFNDLKEQRNIKNLDAKDVSQYSDRSVFRTKNNRTYVKIDDMIIRADLSRSRYSFDPDVRKWPDGILPYEFDGLSKSKREFFHKACNYWSKKAKVRCVKRTNQRNYILVGEYGGNWSYVGMDGGEQEVSIGLWNDRTVAHEVMHALGFVHEHCRPDRDRYVTINWQNIRESAYHAFEKIGGNPITTYDYYSVMHYDARTFSNGGGKTIVPHDSSIDLRIMGYATISETDYQDMIGAYGAKNGGGSDPVVPGPTDPTDPVDPNPGEEPFETGAINVTSWGSFDDESIVIEGTIANPRAYRIELMYDYVHDPDYIHTQTEKNVNDGEPFRISARNAPPSGSYVERVLLYLYDRNDRLLDRVWKFKTDLDPAGPFVVSEWGQVSSGAYSVKGKSFASNGAFVSMYFDRGNGPVAPETYVWLDESKTFELSAHIDRGVNKVFVILFDKDGGEIHREMKTL